MVTPSTEHTSEDLGVLIPQIKDLPWLRDAVSGVRLDPDLSAVGSALAASDPVELALMVLAMAKTINDLKRHQKVQEGHLERTTQQLVATRGVLGDLRLKVAEALGDENQASNVEGFAHQVRAEAYQVPELRMKLSREKALKMSREQQLEEARELIQARENEIQRLREQIREFEEVEGWC
jgi:predicted translin family RNA/ssDNA-binding protein